MSYPEYINDEPQTITLRDYDDAEWAKTTCLDFRKNEYVVVEMENPDNVIAKIDSKENDVLDRIFKSAKGTHAKQQQENK
ncbi:uncharacterized protein KGF55_000748 [Candida pseudojiufengensis]|uniref:uncharacterized protein n=1 Tax=Candida pseudojiufengensis TaxID=497109 RepID=UPI0022253CFB|nr:uncharacterized protein KGF55_000748 [Candida pseudojiufengensis]KAI5966439.1 hypothetical protein KGF55_000748 [Candida pseudojiufengensis]